MIFKKFPGWGWDSLQSLYRNSPYLNLDEFDKSPVEDIQDNPVNLFKLPVDDEDDKTKEIVLQDILQRKNEMLKQQHGEYFRSILNNIRSKSYLIEDDENVMKEASKKLKSLKNFIEESLPRESGISLLKFIETDSSCEKPTAKTLPVNTKLNSCENRIKFTDIPARKHKNFQSNCVEERKEKMAKACKISIREIEKNSKAAISENKAEEVVTDNIDYEDAVQFEAFNNSGEDPVSNNAEEESRCALNYSDL